MSLDDFKAIADEPVSDIENAVANFDSSKPTHYHVVICYNPVADESLLLDYWVENPEYESNVFWYGDFLHEVSGEVHRDFKGVKLDQAAVGIYHLWGPLGYSKDWETGICDEVWVNAEMNVLASIDDAAWRNEDDGV